MSDGNDFLMGGGNKAVSFKGRRGQWVAGRVLGPPVKRQQSDFTTRKPKFFDNGDPMYAAVVGLASETEADPNDVRDDGLRDLWIQGDMQRAVREAVREAGAEGLEKDGWLAVAWTGEKPSTRGEDQHLYSAQYQKPISSGNQQLMAPPAPPSPAQRAYTPPPAPPVAPAYIAPPGWNTVTATPGTVVQQPAPVTPPATVVNPANSSAMQVACPEGFDPAIWAGMDANQRAGALALMGLPAY